MDYFKRYRKKPLVISAVRWTGDMELAEKLDRDTEGIVSWSDKSYDTRTGETVAIEPGLYVQTLEGSMFAKIGDFIIKGVQGEFYSCDEEVFRVSYDGAD